MSLQDVMLEIAKRMCVGGLNISLIANAKNEISVNMFLPDTLETLYSGYFTEKDKEVVLKAKLDSFKAAIDSYTDNNTVL